MSTYIDCTACGVPSDVCEVTDGGCCDGCRATGGCSHGPVTTPTPQASPPAQDVERVLAEVMRSHRFTPCSRSGGGTAERWAQCEGCSWVGPRRHPSLSVAPDHLAHVAAEQAAALRALPTGDEHCTCWAIEFGDMAAHLTPCPLTNPPAQDPSKETDR